METKENRGGEQQPMKPNGEYASFGHFEKPKSDEGISNEEEIKKLENEYANTKGFFSKAKIKHRIDFLKSGFNTEEEWETDKKKKEEESRLKFEQEFQAKQLAKKQQKEEVERQKQEQLKQDIANAPESKRKQFDIIQKTNPMLDDYHVGIRSPKDIKTFEEAINDEESFGWGDFSKKQAENALKKGTIKIYSSYPIGNGVFVSTSKIQAQQYAGGEGKKVYEQEVPIDKVAWINGDEGQFADIEDKKFANFGKKDKI